MSQPHDHYHRDHAVEDDSAKAVGNDAEHGARGDHDHSGMVEEYRRKFWVSLVLTIPVLILSPMVRDFLGQGMMPLFASEEWVALALSTIIYFWGGWPFLTGAWPEIRSGRPGMMTLVALAISTAYFYSAAVTGVCPAASHSTGNWRHS